jgi:hypothetical protein
VNSKEYPDVGDWLDQDGTVHTNGVLVAPRRRLVTKRASQVAMKRARWLWRPGVEGRIPLGELSLAAGRGNVGKSPFALWLCALATRGVLPGDLLGERLNVAVYASEDSLEATVVPRLKAADADMDKVHLILGTEIETEERAVAWWSDLDLIEQFVVEHDIQILVIDPLHDVYRSEVNTHRTDDVRRGLRPLAAMAHRTGCTVLGLAHFNKGRSDDVAALLSGAHGLRDVVRAVVVFVEGADGQKVLGQEKNNLGVSGDAVPRITYDMQIVTMPIEGRDVEVPVFRPTGHTLATIGELMAGTADTSDVPLAADITWLFQMLADAHPYPVSAALLQSEAEDRDLKWDTIRKKATRSGAMEARKRTGELSSPWEWALTDKGLQRLREAGSP